MDADHLARWYRWVEYAAFGRTLERARFTFLSELRGAHRILVIGEGDGRALQRLLKAAPQASIDVVDSSARMIGLAQARIGETARARFHHLDVLTDPLPRGVYDAAVTYFFLDCLSADQLRLVGQEILARLDPAGPWIVCDFAIPPQGLRKWHAKVWLWIMYRFFAITTGLRVRNLPPIQALLSGLGLRTRRVRVWRLGLIRSEVWARS